MSYYQPPSNYQELISSLSHLPPSQQSDYQKFSEICSHLPSDYQQPKTIESRIRQFIDSTDKPKPKHDDLLGSSGDMQEMHRMYSEEIGKNGTAYELFKYGPNRSIKACNPDPSRGFVIYESWPTCMPSNAVSEVQFSIYGTRIFYYDKNTGKQMNESDVTNIHNAKRKTVADEQRWIENRNKNNNGNCIIL